QDNATSWHDWALDPRREAELAFVQKLVALRASEPVLRRKTFFSGGRMRDSAFKDVVWFRTDGKEMTAEDWSNPATRALGMLLNGDAIPSLDRRGAPIVGGTLLVLTNAGDTPADFVLPPLEWGAAWEA